MLCFQRNSTEVQVIKAGAYCFHLPSAANDIIKHSCRGKLAMISVNKSRCHHFTISKCFLHFSGFFFFLFFTTKHTIYQSFLCRCLEQSTYTGTRKYAHKAPIFMQTNICGYCYKWISLWAMSKQRKDKNWSVLTDLWHCCHARLL